MPSWGRWKRPLNFLAPAGVSSFHRSRGGGRPTPALGLGGSASPAIGLHSSPVPLTEGAAHPLARPRSLGTPEPRPGPRASPPRTETLPARGRRPGRRVAASPRGWAGLGRGGAGRGRRGGGRRSGVGARAAARGRPAGRGRRGARGAGQPRLSPEEPPGSHIAELSAVARHLYSPASRRSLHRPLSLSLSFSPLAAAATPAAAAQRPATLAAGSSRPLLR